MELKSIKNPGSLLTRKDFSINASCLIQIANSQPSQGISVSHQDPIQINNEKDNGLVRFLFGD